MVVLVVGFVSLSGRGLAEWGEEWGRGRVRVEVWEVL